VGQTRHEATGRSGSVIGLRCTCCGESLTAASTVRAVLREVAYEYCAGECRDRHAAAVAMEPAGCGVCDLDAVGDTGRCSAHLGADNGSGAFRLAS
jgi:hypothetical protein